MCLVKCRFTDGPDSAAIVPDQSYYIVNEGDGLHDVDCTADCFPTCTYSWQKQGQAEPVSRNASLQFGNNIRREYAEVYTCTARNPEISTKSSTVQITLVVRCKYDFSVDQ